MRLEDLVPLHTVHDLKTVNDDPWISLAHSGVPLGAAVTEAELYEDNGMCDQCPFCLDECGE